MAEENPFARLFTTPAALVQLAVLEPGEEDALLQLRLITADPHKTAYQCISYDRSRDFGTVEVIVDGQPLPLPLPLVEALSAVRMRDDPSTLWADLLIGNTVEQRSSQASTMKSVVEQSDSVMVWLGPGKAHTPGVFDVFQEIANRYSQACLHTGFPNNARATAQQTLAVFDYLRSKTLEGLQPSNKALWETAAALLSSTYFSSVHIIPEILLGKKVRVTSGSSSISWLDFVSVSRAALFFMAQKLQMSVSQQQQTVFGQIHSIDIAERRKRKGDSIELLPMIQQAGACSTTDLREIVFSMLPIVTPSQRSRPEYREPPLIADYSKSVQEVFADAARYIVHERQDLLLWWAASPPRRRRVLGLPSWVPDWNTELPKTTAKVMPTEKNGMRRWWDNLRPAPPRMKVDHNKMLHVQAHALDRIVSVSPIMTLANCRRVCLEQWRALPTVPGETEEAKLEKLWRSLIYNIDGVGETLGQNSIPPKEMWQSFYSLVVEEQILDRLSCTTEQLQSQPALIARARADPTIAALGRYTGRSPPFERLLHANGLGRRVFRTAGGNVGVTAVEALAEGDEQTASSSSTAGPRAPDFDAILDDPLARNLLQGFQAHLQRQHPESARVLSQGMAGELAGQRPPGVRIGDLVVALVGGFQPYVLRPVRQSGARDGTTEAETSQQTLSSVSKYSYVGDCYLHGVMDGEPFKVGEQWKPHVDLVGITIV